MADEQLVSGVLQRSAQNMKPLVILIVIGILYGVATVKAKSLLEGVNHLQICDFDLTRRGCGLLSQFGVR